MIADIIVRNPHELVIDYAIIYFFCFLGLLVKDSKHAKDYHQKIDIKNTLSSTITATILMATIRSIFEDKHFNDAVWLGLCFFAGMWSRELLCILTNTKLVLLFIRAYVKKAAKDAGGELSESDSQIIDDAIGGITSDNTSSNGRISEMKKKNPPGEFDYDDIIDIYK